MQTYVLALVHTLGSCLMELLRDFSLELVQLLMAWLVVLWVGLSEYCSIVRKEVLLGEEVGSRTERVGFCANFVDYGE